MYWCKNDPNSVADALSEYQLWRRGEGKYGENVVNGEYVHVPCPFDPKELGEIEDAAIAFLRKHSEVCKRLMEVRNEV